MNHLPAGRLRFELYFRIRLIQMMRHGETLAAARLSATEVLHAIRIQRKAEALGTKPSGGPLMVPARERNASLKQEAAQSTELQRGTTRERSHGWER